jgi:hypothetical protein
MRDQIDNTPTATQKGAPPPSTRDKNHDSESFTLTTLADGHTLLPCLCASLPLFVATLADGHTMPSENAVSRSASTKLPKLMDTLSDPIRIEILSGARRAKDLSNVTLRCNVVALRARRSNVTSPSGRYHQGLFSTRVPRKESRKSSSINKSAKTSRHTFNHNSEQATDGIKVANRRSAAKGRGQVPTSPLRALATDPSLRRRGRRRSLGRAGRSAGASARRRRRATGRGGRA